jgi:hypothetical protein
MVVLMPPGWSTETTTLLTSRTGSPSGGTYRELHSRFGSLEIGHPIKCCRRLLKSRSNARCRLRSYTTFELMGLLWSTTASAGCLRYMHPYTLLNVTLWSGCAAAKASSTVTATDDNVSSVFTNFFSSSTATAGARTSAVNAASRLLSIVFAGSHADTFMCISRRQNLNSEGHLRP